MSSETVSRGKGEGLQTDILRDTLHGVPSARGDLVLLKRALRRGWLDDAKLPESKRAEIVSRLYDIVKKREATVMTKEGPAALDAPADANAIRAAGVLVQMSAQDQTDHWNQDRNDRLDQGKPTEIHAAVAVDVPQMPAADVEQVEMIDVPALPAPDDEQSKPSE